MPDMTVKCKDDPEANGRSPRRDDQRWVVHLPLEDGSTLTVMMGRKSRDTLFGMLIADTMDSDEKEPSDGSYAVLPRRV